MQLTGTIRRGAAAAALAVAFGAAATPGRAEEIAFASDDFLARTLLPFAPVVFDLAVQSGRSFAEIGYDRRGYDAVTGSFYVNGLTVRRAPLNLRIERMRVAPRAILLEDVVTDTATLDLPEPMRDLLRRLGQTQLTGDVMVNLETNAARSAYDIDIQLDFAGIGAVALNAQVDGLHFLVPLADIEYGSLSDEPVISGVLRSASVAYKDYGLMGAAIDIGAAQSGVTAEEMRAGLVAMPIAMAAQMVDGLPGGASPALKEAAAGWARVIEAFLRDSGAIRVTLRPQQPVVLSRLQAGILDESLIGALNPSFSNSFDPDPSAETGGRLGEALALLSGSSEPQNREAGAEALLRLAEAGDFDAVLAIGREFGAGALPDLDEAKLTAIYANMLAARAAEDTVPDAALARFADALSPEAQLQAEKSAEAIFYTRNPARPKPLILDAATLSDYDAARLRALAFDLYEGRGVPRNITRAYAVAQVAAAAGDPLAARLRDDIAAAAREEQLVLSDDEVDTNVGLVWDAWKASRGAQGQRN